MFEKIDNIIWLMGKYYDGKIYKIECKTSGDIYIGSTYCTLNDRLQTHKKYPKEQKIRSYDILQNNNYEILLLENYPCYSKQQLERREGWYQKNINCVNKKIAGRTDQEYRDDHKKESAERSKINYLKNIPLRRQQNKEWRINNPEKEKEIRKKNESKRKEKIPCPLCGKLVSRRRIVNDKHQKSSRCIKK